MAEKFKAIYCGIFLTPLSVERCRKLAALPKQFCHHVTIAFKPDAELVKSLPMGESVSLEPVAMGNDGKAQALGVHIKGTVIDCFPAGQKPHITLSTDGETSPAHSNELTFDTFIPPFERPILEGRVGIFTGKDVQFDLSGTIYEEE